MNSGLYTAYSGLSARYESLAVVANNLANADSPGFKADRPFYRMYHEALGRAGGSPLEQAINSGVVLEGPSTDFSPGVWKSTGNELDLAIESGFFVIETPQGPRYSRSGSFTLDASRRLVTRNGSPVLGLNGPVTLPEGRIHVDSQGSIYANGENIGQLKVANFARLDGLRKEGHALFIQSQPNEPDTGSPAPGIRQGYLERANVDPIAITIDMVELMRQFQALEKSIEVLMNDVNGRVIDQVGRST